MSEVANKIYVEITKQPVNCNQVLNQFYDLAHGAQSYFFGRVRNHNLGRKVVKISYDIYPPLALNTFQAICKEAQQQWGDQLKLGIIHASGELTLGEVSVGIIASSVHRKEAFQACRYLIEELKHRAPIWKKEFYEDGESEWVQGHALCQEHA